jgi:hypothetical protein
LGGQILKASLGTQSKESNIQEERFNNKVQGERGATSTCIPRRNGFPTTYWSRKAHVKGNPHLDIIFHPIVEAPFLGYS